ncbi:helix-turn-helix transcriptional regulator [Streptomyces sp. NBC_01410]|uniref:helix-turn-helix transcriptional regulator n=1 Tax=Streptomyces sp. NBC_01410 TaxID=2903856 RepID=UPI003244FEAD
MPRPESPIHADASDELTTLVRLMRELRNTKAIPYGELAKRCHYSVATLSTAASGKKVPSWEIVQAYVLGCDPTTDLPEWKERWQAAHTVEADRAHVARHVVHHRKPSWLNRPRTAEQPAMPSQSLAELVREAAMASEKQQNLPQPVRSDPMRTALGLCTTPADFTALLKDIRERAELSLRDITERSRQFSTPISKSAVHDMLTGRKLPSTELLHTYLLACGLAPENTLAWHHTATRLKISQIRRTEHPPRPRLFSRTHINSEPIWPLLMTLLLAATQIIQLTNH